ncbi:unnamed protein product [Gulo gulo]|uniref:Uncharacterized protein n=1 Tax=Gulo gulo TaxID=48420 RepID=A0A9X9M5Q5_GULGU|nr:unnamed protein product [Gulo gulo]
MPPRAASWSTVIPQRMWKVVFPSIIKAIFLPLPVSLRRSTMVPCWLAVALSVLYTTFDIQGDWMADSAALMGSRNGRIGQ